MNYLRYVQTISWLLGTALFMFGFLKFFDPFKGWYTVQIENSGLGDVSYALGIAGELMVGICLLFLLILRRGIAYKLFKWAVVFASFVIIVMMLTGVYVHLHPSVPYTVLPMNIKPPYIPGFFILLALVNIVLVLRNSYQYRLGS